MADAIPVPNAPQVPGTPQAPKPETPRLTGLKKRQQIQIAERKMFAWVVVAAVAVSFCLAAGQYLFTKWQYNNKVLGAKYKASEVLTQNLVNAKSLTDEVNALIADNSLSLVKTDPDDSNLKSILDALPTTADPAALATSLQLAVLNRSGVTIESITVPPESDATATTVTATPQEMRFGFIVSGSYKKVEDMMHDLERTIRPIKIISINLNGSDNNLRASVEAVTYFQPSKSVAAPEEAIQ